MVDLAGVRSQLFSMCEMILANCCRLGDVINSWRSTIDLEPVPTNEGATMAQTLKIPFTYCWSPALLPKPIDWPAYIGMLPHDAWLEKC